MSASGRPWGQEVECDFAEFLQAYDLSLSSLDKEKLKHVYRDVVRSIKSYNTNQNQSKNFLISLLKKIFSKKSKLDPNKIKDFINLRNIFRELLNYDC